MNKRPRSIAAALEKQANTLQAASLTLTKDLKRIQEMCDKVQPRFRIYGPIKCDGCKRQSAQLYNCRANCCKPKRVLCEGCSELPITRTIQVNQAVCTFCWNYLLSLEDEVTKESFPTAMNDSKDAQMREEENDEMCSAGSEFEESNVDKDNIAGDAHHKRGYGTLQVCLQGIDGSTACTPYVSVEYMNGTVRDGTGTTGNGLVKIIKAGALFAKWVDQINWRAQTISYRGKALRRQQQLFKQGVIDGSRITVQIKLPC